VTGPRQDGSPSEADAAQRHVEEVRAELGDTVEELVHRVDVPQRLREKRAETTERVQAQVIHARDAVAEKAPVLQRTLRDRPAVVGGVLAALLLLFLRTLRRRRTHRKEDT
jgi:hypothetical protein